MIADTVRMECYVEALRGAVSPGCTVLDIGTGTGIAAMIACQFGAKCVYAVEPSNVLAVASELAAENGYDDRITFLKGISTELTLPTLADVIVSDLRGVLPLFGHHIESIADARARLLRPGGTMIPMRDLIWGALVQSTRLYHEVVGPWTQHSRGLAMSAAKRREVNTWRKARIQPTELLTLPKQWTAIDYGTVQSPNASGALRWTCSDAGSAHGLALWFDTELASGLGFSNAPSEPRAIYGQAFFPFSAVLNVTPGDRVEIDVRADLVGDDYVWAWETRHVPAQLDSHRVTVLRQHSLNALLLAPDELQRRSHRFVPTLDEDAHVDRLILASMDGHKSNGEIARVVQQAFPQRYPSWQDALGRVSDWSANLKAPAISSPAIV